VESALPEDVPGEQPGAEATAPDRRSAGLVVGVVVATLEAILLIGYAASIGVFELFGSTRGIGGRTDLAPMVLIGLLAVFGFLVALIARALWERRAAARTPFVLLQAFTVVAAWPLATGEDGWLRVLGIALLLAAAASAVGVMAASGELRR